MKEKKATYKIEWRIMGKATAYDNNSKKCNLCNLEKYFILCHENEATLNQKCGLINNCKHAPKFLLANHPI